MWLKKQKETKETLKKKEPRAFWLEKKRKPLPSLDASRFGCPRAQKKKLRPQPPRIWEAGIGKRAAAGPSKLVNYNDTYEACSSKYFGLKQIQRASRTRALEKH